MGRRVLQAVVDYGTFPVDPKRPKAAIAEMLGYAPSSGRQMFVDTPTGTRHVGYVFGEHWVTLEWVESTPWEGKL